ncbi:MAG: peptidylprolyl isomerase, partial [Gemmataceae bacterium]|nr:peptidylprolyl isomerase [Gemmataceae bacterium]
DVYKRQVVDNPNLDRREGSAGYCVFGKVIEGMDVVDAIRSVPTRDVQRGGRILWEAVPVEDIVIRSARRWTK